MFALLEIALIYKALKLSFLLTCKDSSVMKISKIKG